MSLVQARSRRGKLSSKLSETPDIILSRPNLGSTSKSSRLPSPNLNFPSLFLPYAPRELVSLSLEWRSPPRTIPTNERCQIVFDPSSLLYRYAENRSSIR